MWRFKVIFVPLDFSDANFCPLNSGPLDLCRAISFKSPFLTAKLEMWPQISTFCSHNSKCDRKMLKVAVMIRNLTAKCWKLRSHFKICNHVTAKFEMWPQNVESCSHNSKCDCNFQHFAVRFRNLQSRDCNFRNVTAIFQNLPSRDCNFRNMTAKFEKWPQNSQIWW